MSVTLEKLSKKNQKKVYEFECEQHKYFKSVGLERPESYYRWETYVKQVEMLLKEQEQGDCYLYIIKRDNQVVGRINFYNIEQTNILKAEVGYRLGLEFQGKGIASKALTMAIDILFNQYDFDMITAGTASDNLDSQKLLTRTGFDFTKCEKRFIKQTDQTVESKTYVLYNRIQLIKRYWHHAITKNVTLLRDYFKPEAIIYWHNTNERFTLDDYIIANCEYPGAFYGKVERIEVLNDLVITVARVCSKENEQIKLHATSFFKFKGNKIIKLDEYWGDDGIAPQWRLDKKIGTTIEC